MRMTEVVWCGGGDLYFNRFKYFSQTARNCKTSSVYISFVDALTITFHATMIISTITPDFTNFPSSPATCFDPTTGLTRLLTFFVIWYLQSNAEEVGNAVATTFINVVSQSVTITFGISS